MPGSSSNMMMSSSQVNQHLYTPAMSSGMRMHYASSPAFAQVHQPSVSQEPATTHAMDASFTNAFDQIESELKQEEQIAPPTMDDSDLSELASSIIGNIKTTSTSLKKETTDKFQQSNFMALMSQLSSREVELKNNEKFVSTVSGTEINVNELPRSESLNMNPEEMFPTQAHTAKEESSSQQPHLEDPFAYFERMGKKIDEVMTTPFEVAQAIAPPGALHRSQWEESLDDSVGLNE